MKVKFDIIAVSETWNPDYKHTFHPPHLDGYLEYKGTPGSSLKGGCGLYINTELKPIPRKDLNMQIKENNFELETFWLEIALEKQPTRLIGVVYRHPTKTNDTKTTEMLNTTVQKNKKESKKVLLAGDFNFDLLNHDKYETISLFLQMMLQNNFQPCITEPTRVINGNKSSLLDNIFSNSIESITSGNVYEKISDHMPNQKQISP